MGGSTGHDYFQKHRNGHYYTDVWSILVYVLMGVNFALLFVHSKNFYQFWQHRQSIAIARRHPDFVLLFNAMLLLFSHVYSPFQALVVCVQWFRAPFWTIYLGFGFTCFGVCWIFLMRAWLLYFAHRYHSAIACGQQSSEWFVRNAHTWGRPEWLFWPVVACWLLSTAALTAAALWVETVYPRFYSILLLLVCIEASIPFAFVFWLWYDLRVKQSGRDVFHIQEELIVAALLTFTMCALYCVNHLCWAFWYPRFSPRELRDRIDSLVFLALCFTWSNVIMFHSTSRTLSANRKFLNMRLRRGTTLVERATTNISAGKLLKWHQPTTAYRMNISGTQPSEPPSIKSSSHTTFPIVTTPLGHDEEDGSDFFIGLVADEDEDDIVDLYEVLVYDECFELFANHLRREFSGEILYSFVELTQYTIHCLKAGFWEVIEWRMAEERAAEAKQVKFEEVAEERKDEEEDGGGDGKHEEIEMNDLRMDDMGTVQKTTTTKLKRRRKRAAKKPQFLPNFSKVIPESTIIAAHPFNEDEYGGGGVFAGKKVVKKGADSQKKFESVKLIALELFEKYMSAEAPLELNLPSRMRAQLVRLMRSKKKWMERDVDELKMLHLFEKVRMEMHKMMRFSLDLMRATDQWPEMVDAANRARAKDEAVAMSHPIAPDDFDDTHSKKK